MQSRGKPRLRSGLKAELHPHLDLQSFFIDKRGGGSVFDGDAGAVENGDLFFRGAARFDMYQPGGFGHRGDECTFETLLREFKLQSKQLKMLAEMVHDADLKDEKY